MNSIENPSGKQPSTSLAIAEKGLEVIQSEAMACRTMAQALSAPTLLSVVRSNGAGPTGVAVAAIIHAAMENFAPARRMGAGQIMLFAEDILDRYKYESLADVALFMRNCVSSKYDDGEFYNSVDVPRMNKWWSKYLEEKAEAREVEGNRWNDEQGQIARDRVAAIPGMSKIVDEVVQASKQDRRAQSLSARIEKLGTHLPIMTDEQLRDAWKVYPTAGERSLIMQEADRRGLVAKALDKIVNPEPKAEEQP